MNKKAAIELSVNFIVVIILSLVIVSSGIYVISKFFTESEKLQGTIQDATESEIESLLAPGQQVAIIKNRKSISGGNNDYFNLIVLNIRGEKTDFNVDITFNKAYDSSNNEISILADDAEKWLHYISDFSLDNNKAKKLSIFVAVDKSAKKGEYIFDVDVKQTGESYGSKNKLYVIV